MPETVPLSLFCQTTQLDQAPGSPGQETPQFAIQRSAATEGSPTVLDQNEGDE